MKIKTMRTLDYWIGVPLCFLSTILVRLLGTPRGPDRPARVLFLELSEMGSTIIANPAIEKVRDTLDAEVYFLIFRRNVESLRLLDAVPESNIFTIRESNAWVLAVDTLRFLWNARKARIDTVIDLELFSRFTALLTGLSGARRRVGFYRFRCEGLYRGNMMTHPVAYNTHIHMAKNFVSMVNALLAPGPERPYSKACISDEEIRLPIQPVTAEACEEMRELVRSVYSDYQPDYHRIVLLNPNGSELLPQRRWPRENFCRLATMIADNWEDALVLITGSPAEREEALQMQMDIDHPRVLSLAGRHCLAAILALYNISTLLVTNDSGPGHFSSITPIRSIVLFGPETPKLYGSLGNSESITADLACSPCVTAANHRNTACNDPVCMRMITTERVFESVRATLDGEVERAGVLVQLAVARR